MICYIVTIGSSSYGPTVLHVESYRRTLGQGTLTRVGGYAQVGIVVLCLSLCKFVVKCLIGAQACVLFEFGNVC